MGRCFEFVTEICAQCDQPMVAGSDSCTCAHCASVCTGRFSGCADVWEAQVSVLTLPWEPMLDPSGAEAGVSLADAFDNATTPTSDSSSPSAPPRSGRHRSKKHRGRNTATIAATRASEPLADPEPWRVGPGDRLPDVATVDAPTVDSPAVDVPAVDVPAVDPVVEATQERLATLERVLAQAHDRIRSLEAGTSDLEEHRGRQDTMTEQADTRLTLAEARLGNSERALGEQADAVEARLASLAERLGGIDELAATVSDQAPRLAALAEVLEQRGAAVDGLLERSGAGDERLSGLTDLLHVLDARLSDDTSKIEALAREVTHHAEAGKRRCAEIESRLDATNEGLDRRVIDLTDTVVEHRHVVEQRLGSQHGGGAELQRRLKQIEGISRRTAADHDNIAEAYSERLIALERRLEPAELGLARVNRMAKDLKAFLARVNPVLGPVPGHVDQHDGESHNLEAHRSPSRQEVG